jgi:23S rRNA (guanine745-N1)-methyltransferase
VSLLTGSQAPGTADTAEMVAARADFLAAGHYAPLTRALADAVAEQVTPPRADTEHAATRRGPLIVDAGAGTGHYLAAVLDRLAVTEDTARAAPAVPEDTMHAAPAVPEDTARAASAVPEGAAVGIAFDISKHAIRRAARAHERLGALVADVWKPLPIADGVADVVIDVFAPRNGPEFARILRSGGMLMVVTPAPSHLSPLVEQLGLLSVDESKEHRIAESLREFVRTDRRVVEFEMALSHREVAEVVAMGPSAWHTDPEELNQQITKFHEPTPIKAAFHLSIFQAPSQSRPVT